MSTKISTGLRNYLADGYSLREAFEDAIINVYDGQLPATADALATGNLLARITLAGSACTVNTRSTPQVDQIVITAGTTSDTFTITINSVDYVYTEIGGDTASTICVALAALLRDNADVVAIPVTGTTEKAVYLLAKQAGVAVTVAVSKSSSGGTITLTNKIANVRINSLQFAVNAGDGSISKESGSWKGVGLKTAQAGYYRLVTTSDDGTLSATQRRVQGACGVGGGEMNFEGSTNVALGADVTITSYKLTIKDISS